MQDRFIKDVYFYAKFHEESLENAKKELEYIFKYKENYLKAYLCAKKAFLEVDPVGIAWVDWYEYDPEIIDMAYRLQHVKPTKENVQKIAKDVLDRWFVKGWYDEGAEKLAENYWAFCQENGNQLDFSEEIEKLYRHYCEHIKDRICEDVIQIFV